MQPQNIYTGHWVCGMMPAPHWQLHDHVYSRHVSAILIYSSNMTWDMTD